MVNWNRRLSNVLAKMGMDKVCVHGFIYSLAPYAPSLSLPSPHHSSSRRAWTNQKNVSGSCAQLFNSRDRDKSGVYPQCTTSPNFDVALLDGAMISSRLFSSVAFRSLRCVRYLFAPIPRQELITKEKARLRDRPFLPGSSDGGFPEFLAEPTESFPHAVQVQRELSLEESSATVRKYIDENLVQQGAILFRGLPLRTVDDYAAFQIHLGYDAMGYEGGTGARTMVNKDASMYTASDFPPEDSMDMHNDMAYSSIFPHKVLYVRPYSDHCHGVRNLVAWFPVPHFTTQKWNPGVRGGGGG